MFFMSKKKQRDIELFIVDIFVAVHQLQKYTEPFSSKDDFRHSSLHWDASIRQLEIIGEALNKLLENENFSRVSPKYFRKIVNFRNVISHGYFGIDVDEVWNVIKEKLDILNKDLEIIVGTEIDLHLAITTEIEEYMLLEDISLVRFLTDLQKKFTEADNV